MINHARTLLLNVSGASSQSQYIGEEYIPPAYTPIALPTYLALPHKLLFGSAPDRYFINFRAQELLRYIHETELAEFVYALDPRVTYWPVNSTPFVTEASKISIAQTGGTTGSRISVTGTPRPLNGQGRSMREYSVQIEAGAAVVSLVNEPAAVTATTTTPLTVTSGLSQPVPLPQSELWLKITNPQNGVRWQIIAIAKPDPAVTTLLPTLELMGEPLFLELFGVAPKEPFATFKNLWFDHPSPVYHMGGLLLAMIYRLEELRGRNRG